MRNDIKLDISSILSQSKKSNEVSSSISKSSPYAGTNN